MSFHANLRWPYECDAGEVARWVDVIVEPIDAEQRPRFRISFPCGTSFVVRRKTLSRVPYIIKAKGPMGISRFDHLKLVSPWPDHREKATRKQQRIWNDELGQGAEVAREVVLDHVTDLDLRNLSTAAHRLAKYGIPRCDPCWGRLCAHLREGSDELKGMSAQGLANIVWALGKTGLENKEVEEIVGWATLRAKEFLASSSGLMPFKPQELANLLLGAAKLDLLDVDFACEVGSRCVAMQWKGFSPQEMTNILWALTRGGCASPYIVANVVKKTGKNISMFKPSEMCNIVWSVAKSALTSKTEFVQQVLNVVAERDFAGFNPQDVSNLLWAVATLEMKVGNAFLTRAARYATSLGNQFSGVDAACLIWAFAKLAFYDSAFIQALADHVATKVTHLTAQAVANFAKALATFAFYHPVIHDLAARALAPGAISAFTPQNLANVIYSCALLGTLEEHTELMRRTEELMSICSAKIHFEQVEHRSQLAVAHQCIHRGTEECPREWKEALLQKHRYLVEDLDGRSAFHKQVCEDLETKCGLECVNEVVLDDFFVVDIVASYNCREVVVECDGPHHFLASAGTIAKKSSRPNGATQLKRKLLIARGHAFIPVSQAIWTEQGVAYIQSLLRSLEENEPLAKRRRLGA